MHFLQTAKRAKDEKVAAVSLIRAVLRRGREKINPREVLSRVGGDGVALPPAELKDGEVAALTALEKAMAE